MGCKHKKLKVGFNGDYKDMNMKDLANQGNKSIDGLIFKCPVVRRGSVSNEKKT